MVQVQFVDPWLAFEDASLQGATLGELQLLRQLLEDGRIQAIIDMHGRYGWHVVDENLDLVQAINLLHLTPEPGIH